MTKKIYVIMVKKMVKVKNPAGFLTLTFFFTLTEFLFWGLNAHVLLIKDCIYVLKWF